MNIKNNYPLRLEQSDYERCVELVLDEASNNSTISSVYLMGGEWCPGISDLDIVAIYKDGLIPKPLSSPWSLSEKARFIFTHRYLSFSHNSAEYFHFLYPKETANLRLLLGPEHKFWEIPSSDRQWVLAFILFDVLVNKLLLLSKFKKPPQNVRQLLGFLYSLVYTAWMVQEISGKDIGCGFEKKIQKLREEWFTLDEDLAMRELLGLLEEGVALVSRAVTALDDFVSGKTKVSESFSNTKFSNDKLSVRFIPEWSAQKFIEEFDKSLIWDSKVFNKKVESFRLLLPLSLSIFFQAYARGEGKFSSAMRQHLSGTIGPMEVGHLGEHVRAVNLAYESSIASGGLFKIPYTYGFFAGKRGFRSKLFWKCCSLLRDIR